MFHLGREGQKKTTVDFNFPSRLEMLLMINDGVQERVRVSHRYNVVWHNDSRHHGRGSVKRIAAVAGLGRTHHSSQRNHVGDHFVSEKVGADQR